MKITKYEIIQFFKFNIVGISNTIVDYGIFALLTWLGMGDIFANIISYSCGIVNSYIWNTTWTFKRERKRSRREMLLFIAVNLVSLGVSTGVLYVCEKFLGIESSLLRKLFAIGASFIINFLGNKLIVFKPTE